MMIWARLVAFLSLIWLMLLAGCFLIEGYELETKVQWVLTISASVVLAAFVVLA